jgi:hypothetical protein
VDRVHLHPPLANPRARHQRREGGRHLPEIEPGRSELAPTDSWTGPKAGPSAYEAVRAGFDEWIDLLEKLF